MIGLMTIQAVLYIVAFISLISICCAGCGEVAARNEDYS